MVRNQTSDFTLSVALAVSPTAVEPLLTLLRRWPVDNRVQLLLHGLPWDPEPSTPWPVRYLNAPVRPLGGHLYLAHPEQPVRFENGVTLMLGEPVGMPVDTLFASLPGRQTLACVIGDLGIDGHEGLKALRRRGGVIVACDGGKRVHPAIRQLVDRMISIEQLPGLLQQLLFEKESTEDMARVRAAGPCSTVVADDLFGRVLWRRRALAGGLSVPEYIALLEGPSEREELSLELERTPGRFWRHPQPLERLASVLKDRFARQGPGEFRAWVPQCHTGEDAYAVATILREALDQTGLAQVPLRVFGTDLDPRDLTRARSGRLEVEPDLIEQLQVCLPHLEGGAQGWRLGGRLRESCVFSVHHLLDDPPFRHLDLLALPGLASCGETLQALLLPLLRWALKSDGLLFTGEASPAELEQFIAVDGRAGIYRPLSRDRRISSVLPLKWTRVTAGGPMVDGSTTEHLDWAIEELTSARDRQARLDESLQLRVGQLRQTRQDLLAANQQLKREAEEKDRFIATLAHELRNPLAPIVNCLHLLAEGHIEDQTEFVDMLGSQARHLSRLVDDLLDVSRMQRGILPVELEPLELRSLVIEAVRLWTLSGRRRGPVRLQVTEEELPVLADQERIKQVLYNLLNNSASHSPSEKPIVVSLEMDDREAVLSVIDYGSGIPQAMIDKIFEPFVQAEKGRDRALGGLGIGLSLVKAIVERHQGTIAAESPGEGLGTTMTLRLPVRDFSLPQKQEQEVVVGHRTHRVLLVEDNPIVARSTIMMLRSWGHEVCHARDGESALVRAREFLPTAAILDIGLPGRDGYQVLEDLLTIDDVEFETTVALSGYEARSDPRCQLFDHYMTKPAKLEVLRAILAR
ncbi:MAG: ATP-binding protein [Vulcanimicrobiota bacterium]